MNQQPPEYLVHELVLSWVTEWLMKPHKIEEVTQLIDIFPSTLMIKSIPFGTMEIDYSLTTLDNLDLAESLSGFMFDAIEHLNAYLFVESYPQAIGLGVIAWFALLGFGMGTTILKIAKHYVDNRYKDGIVSSWIHNLKLPKFKSKVSLNKGYKQPWYVILLEYYRSIKEKTCKKIEFED